MASCVRMGAAMNNGWTSDWYSDDRYSSGDRGYTHCMHRHVVVETNGGMQFIQGEVSDNIRDQLRCLDCLDILDEQEVLCAWHGEAHFIDVHEQEDSYGDD